MEASHQDINHQVVKLIVGLIALSLAGLTSLFAPATLTSISASYWAGSLSQAIFVGFLFAIAAFLFAYNGVSTLERHLSSVAAVASMAIALVPCACEGGLPLCVGTPPVPSVPYVGIPNVHWVSAAVMFLVLAYFCNAFRLRALAKGHPEALKRARVYAVCLAGILSAILLLGVDMALGGAITKVWPTTVFWGENLGLTSFGICWLTAAKVIPVLARVDERLVLSPFS